MFLMVYNMKVECFCYSVYLYFIVKYISDMMLGHITLKHCGEHPAAILLYGYLFITRNEVDEIAHITEYCIRIPRHKVSNALLYLLEDSVTGNICAANTTQANLYYFVSSEHSSFSHRYFCTPASRSSNFLEGFLIVIVLELLIIILFISSAKIRKRFESYRTLNHYFSIFVFYAACLLCCVL